MGNLLARISFSRSVTSYSKIQHFVSRLIRNRAFQLRRLNLYQNDYLDIGCGPNTHTNYINLDYIWHPQIDICWDITKGLPLPNDSIRGIFTEHTLEHISFDAADFVLRECYRILKPGGTLRIIVPDGQLYLSRYTDIVRNKSTIALPYSQNDFRLGLYSPIMSVNRIFYDHGHKFIYDFHTLHLLLEKNHFVSVEQETYNNGRDTKLLIDTKARSIESLYVEASK